jgi:hypothetical protein
MANTDQAVKDILRDLPKLDREPALRGDELLAVGHVVKALPKLKFPIKDAKALADQVGDTVEVLGVKGNARNLARRLPKDAFPIDSLPELMETIAAQLRRSPRLSRLARELDALGRQVPPLEFPVTSRKQLLEQVNAREFTFRGQRIASKKAVEQFPKSFYPIRSRLDLKLKAGVLALRGGR